MNQSTTGFQNPIGYYDPAVQELIVIDDVLSAMVAVEGRYILIKTVRGKKDDVTFLVDPSMDLALQELAKRIFPLCRSYLLINQFVESRSQFQNGLVNHAFSAALRALLIVCFPEQITRPWWHSLSTNFVLGDFPFKDYGSTVSR